MFLVGASRVTAIARGRTRRPFVPHNALDRLRASVARFFIAGLWLHVPVLLAVGLLDGTSWIAGPLAGAGAAGIATAIWLPARAGRHGRDPGARPPELRGT